MFLVVDDQKGEKGEDASGGPRVGRSHQPTTGNSLVINNNWSEGWVWNPGFPRGTREAGGLSVCRIVQLTVDLSLLG